MDTSLNNIPLPPWQGTILTWAGGIMLVLLLSLTLMRCLGSDKKQVKDKIYTVFCFIFGAFLLSALIYLAMGISFFIGIELGWKLALLAGVSVVLFAISCIAITCNSIGRPMKKRYFFIWVALFVLSAASLLSFFGYWGSQEARNLSKEHSIEH